MKDFKGLSDNEVLKSRELHGSNKLPEPKLKKWYDYREFAVELSKMITNHLDCVCNNIPTKRENPHSNYRRRKTD